MKRALILSYCALVAVVLFTPGLGRSEAYDHPQRIVLSNGELVSVAVDLQDVDRGARWERRFDHRDRFAYRYRAGRLDRLNDLRELRGMRRLERLEQRNSERWERMNRLHRERLDRLERRQFGRWERLERRDFERSYRRNRLHRDEI